jgi:hypothetical protein
VATTPNRPTALPRRFAPAAASFVLLLGLFVYLFWVPLRPTAWDGPRDKGPFEDEDPPAAGRWARDVRLPLEHFATWRSPSHPLESTGEALLAFHAMLEVARFAVLWLVLWRLGGRGWLATLGVVAAALPMICGGPRHNEWDVGLLLFTLLLVGTTPRRVPWLVAVVGLPALFAVWANAHASAMTGLAWLAVIAVGRAAEWWTARRAGDPDRPTAGRWLLALVLGVAATCLNPDGVHLFVEAFRAVKNPNLQAMPGWQPIDFSKGTGMPWGYFATLAALLVAQLASRRVLAATGLLIVLTFGVWPAIQQRGLGCWWLIVPWLLVPLVTSMWRHDSDLAGAAPDWNRVPTDGMPSLWARRIALGLFALAVLTTPAVRWLVLGPRDLLAIVSADTPARLGQELTAPDSDAGRFLPEFREAVRAAYPDGRYRGAILTGVEQGDFLAWVLDGDNTRPVMVYSRPETFGAATWGEAQGALEGKDDWWETLGRHQVNLIAIDPRRWEKLAGRLRRSPHWRMVEDGPELLVAVRREPKLPAELQQ